LSLTLDLFLDLEGFYFVSEGAEFVAFKLIVLQVNAFLILGLSAYLAALNCDTFSTEFLLSVEFSIVANGYGNGTSSGLHTNTISGKTYLGTHLFVGVATTERIHRVPVVSLRASLTIISLEENGGAEHRRFVGTH
jgi:hypothetical protein